MKYTVPVIIILVLGVFTLHVGHAEVPQQMNYQGRLLDNGNLVTSNNVSITLSLYNGPAGGATLLYREVDTVIVVDGLYSTVIGDNPETVGVAHTVLNDALTAGGASTYLGIALNGASEFTPRAQILSTAFAMQANESDPVFTASAADYLLRTGGTMLGDINMNSNVIENALILPGGDLSMGPFTQGAP
ncbi:MAG: hypothetical protein EOM20_16570 [Spartobacteria bacterium]|nr:hypothetical protein [Spartobacteria bacterium]